MILLKQDCNLTSFTYTNMPDILADFFHCFLLLFYHYFLLKFYHKCSDSKGNLRNGKITFCHVDGKADEITVSDEISIWWQFAPVNGVPVAYPRINRAKYREDPLNQAEKLILDYLEVHTIRFNLPEEIVRLQMPFSGAGSTNTSSLCLLSEAKGIIQEFDRGNASITNK